MRPSGAFLGQKNREADAKDLAVIIKSSGGTGLGRGLTIGGSTWAYAGGNMTIDANNASNATIYLRNDGLGRGDVNVPDGEVTILATGADVNTWPYQLTLRNTTDVAPAPEDYGNEVRLRMRAGTTTDHDRYIEWADYDGTHHWLMGATSSNNFILYCARTNAGHRFYIQDGGYSLINSYGTDAIRFNYHGSDTVGTGGIEVYCGGAGPQELWWVMDSALTQHDGSGSTTGTLINSSGQATFVGNIDTTYTVTVNGEYTHTSGGGGGIYCRPKLSVSGASTGGMTGINCIPVTQTANAYNITYFYGGMFNPQHNGSGTLTTIIGANCIAQNAGAGTTTYARAVSAEVKDTGAGAITTAYSLYIPAAAGTITNNISIRILDQTVGSSMIRGFYSSISSGANKHNLYINGTADNYMAGDTGIGVASPSARLDIDQASTSGAMPVLKLDQADVSEEFIRFVGTAAVGVLTQSIVDEGDQSSETREGWLKVYVQDDGNQITDQAYFVPIYTLA